MKRTVGMPRGPLLCYGMIVMLNLIQHDSTISMTMTGGKRKLRPETPLPHSKASASPRYDWAGKWVIRY